MNFVNDRLEEALVAVLTAPAQALGNVFDGQPVTLCTGKNSADKLLPCVIAAADGGDNEETPINTGNFWVTFDVTIRHRGDPNPSGDESGDNPKSSDQLLINMVWSTLHADNIAAQLSAAVADLTVFDGGVIWNSPKSGVDEAGVWVTQFSGRAYCCGSDLS